MSPAEQIAHYAAVRARLWTPKLVQAKSEQRVKVRPPPRHRLDDPWHYVRSIGPRRVTTITRDRYADRLSDMSPVEAMRQAKQRQHKIALRILGDTATEYGMTLEALFGEARMEPFPTIRAIAIHRCVNAGCSYLGIGRALGRDHTTIRHSHLTRGADGKRVKHGQD